MSKLPCKRIWEGAIGVSVSPRERHDGEYYWTFSFVRAFKRKDGDKWEYTQFFGPKNVEAISNVFSQAVQFMEETDAAVFVKENSSGDESAESEVPTAATH